MTEWHCNLGTQLVNYHPEKASYSTTVTNIHVFRHNVLIHLYSSQLTAISTRSMKAKWIIDHCMFFVRRQMVIIVCCFRYVGRSLCADDTSR